MHRNMSSARQSTSGRSTSVGRLAVPFAIAACMDSYREYHTVSQSLWRTTLSAFQEYTSGRAGHRTEACAHTKAPRQHCAIVASNRTCRLALIVTFGISRCTFLRKHTPPRNEAAVTRRWLLGRIWFECTTLKIFALCFLGRCGCRILYHIVWEPLCVSHRNRRRTSSGASGIVFTAWR
jgi:hypothetical protein